MTDGWVRQENIYSNRTHYTRRSNLADATTAVILDCLTLFCCGSQDVTFLHLLQFSWLSCLQSRHPAPPSPSPAMPVLPPAAPTSGPTCLPPATPSVPRSTTAASLPNPPLGVSNTAVPNKRHVAVGADVHGRGRWVKDGRRRARLQATGGRATPGRMGVAGLLFVSPSYSCWEPLHYNGRRRECTDMAEDAAWDAATDGNEKPNEHTSRGTWTFVACQPDTCL